MLYLECTGRFYLESGEPLPPLPPEIEMEFDRRIDALEDMFERRLGRVVGERVKLEIARREEERNELKYQYWLEENGERVEEEIRQERLQKKVMGQESRQRYSDTPPPEHPIPVLTQDCSSSGIANAPKLELMHCLLYTSPSPRD